MLSSILFLSLCPICVVVCGSTKAAQQIKRISQKLCLTNKHAQISHTTLRLHTHVLCMTILSLFKTRVFISLNM